MSLNSREKFFRGQREFAKKCHEYGYTAVHCSGGVLEHGGLPGIHPEVRRAERLRLERDMEQARQNSGGLLPIVAHWSNRSTWKITMELDTFFRLYSAFIQRHRTDPASPAAAPCPDSNPAPDHRP